MYKNLLGSLGSEAELLPHKPSICFISKLLNTGSSWGQRGESVGPRGPFYWAGNGSGWPEFPQKVCNNTLTPSELKSQSSPNRLLNGMFNHGLLEMCL